MIRILSIENWHPELSWSWGLVIQRLIQGLGGEYSFCRIRRGEFFCSNPKCHNIFNHNVDLELCSHFDIILPQNIDTLKMIPRGENVVARIGGMHVSNTGNPTQRDRYNDQIARVGAVVATNNDLLEIGQRANSNCHLIPNGVDLTHFRPRPDADVERPGFMLGFAGNIEGAGADYKGWRPFVIAGTRLMSQGVETRYLLHGRNQIENVDMPAKFYHLIDALVLPSRGEGCSNVVTEALACGVPVLITKVGFHGESLTDGENCLFIERNDDSIVKAVERLLNDSDLRRRLSENGRRFAEQFHDVNAIAAKYDAVFKSILAKT